MSILDYFRGAAPPVPSVPVLPGLPLPDEQGTPEAREPTKSNVYAAVTGNVFGSGSAPVVTSANISRVTAYASAVNVISQDLAKLPLHVMRTEGKAKRNATDHPNYRLLYLAPNPLMSSYMFRLAMFRWVLYRGNAFAQIQRNRAGRIIALWPLHPDSVNVRVEQDGARLSVYYDVQPTKGPPQTLDASEVFHLRGDSEDGIVGVSPVKQHALALGFAWNTAEFGANFFKNGAHVSLAVTVPPDVAEGDPEKQQRFKAQFDGEHQGVPKAGNTVYLEPGGDVKAISVTPEAAQYLDSRKFSRREVCGILRCPPSKIGDTEEKYSNLEETNASYQTDTLMPWAVQFEQECLIKLFDEVDQSQYSVKFNFDAVLRGMTRERAEALKAQITAGKMTPNEARELDDQPPKEGGDELLVQAGVTTLSALVANGGVPPKTQPATGAEGG